MFNHDVWIYTVTGEEYISDVAYRYNIRTDALLAANPHLEDVFIAEDTVPLIIPLDQPMAQLGNLRNPIEHERNLKLLTKASPQQAVKILLQAQQGRIDNNNDDYIEINRTILQTIMDRCSRVKGLKSKLNLDEVVNALNASMKLAEATNRRREVGFLSQAVIETDYFRTYEEYGKGKGADYGNYYGRGIHQLTWKDTYKKCSHALFQNDSLVNDPDMILKDIQVNIKTTAWFWRDNKPFNTLSDNQDVDEIIYRLYGGKITSRKAKVRKSVRLRRGFYRTIQRILNEASEGKLQ